MQYCSQCGQQLPDEARFCNKCGATVSDQEVAAAAMKPGMPQGKGSPVVTTRTILTGIVIAILLVAGGFWGWRSLGSEARVQKKLDLAVKYLSENKFEEAILAYNDAIKIEPKEVKAYHGLARVYTLQGKYDEAKATYDKGLTVVSPDKKQTLQMGLAGMYIDQGQLASAEKALQEIKNNSKNCLEAYWGLAMVYQKQGDNAKTEAMLRQAVEQNPNEYRAYNTLALFFKQNNKAGESFNNLVKSLALEVNQQEAYLVLSDLYKGRWTQLQAKLSGVSSQQVSAMLEFYSYYAANDYQRAISIYKDKLSQQTGNQKARALAAIAMVKTGDKAGAETLVSQLNKEKLNEWLLGDLAYYYQAAGDKEKAQEYAVKALQANGFNLGAIALLQNLNYEDTNIRIYTAQALLYNWKPVAKMKEEIQALSLPVQEFFNSAVSNINKQPNPSNTQTEMNSSTHPGSIEQPNGKNTTGAVSANQNSSSNSRITYNSQLDNEICYAASNNSIAQVKELLAQGADPNALDDRWDCPLNMAGLHHSTEMAKILIAAGANVNIVPPSGRTPLIMTVKWSYWDGSYDLVQLLLKAGADPNSNDLDGQSAINLAEEQGNTKTADLLREYGSKR